MKKRWFLAGITIMLFTMVTSLDGGYVVRDGKLVNIKDLATRPVEEHFSSGMTAYKEQRWRSAEKQFRIVSLSFPETSFGQDAAFYLAVCQYWLGEYEIANDNADKYIQGKHNPSHLEQAVKLKFACAEKFRKGTYRHLLGSPQLPRVVRGYSLALTIYDDITATLPSNDVAVHSLYAKARLLEAGREFSEAIETHQMLLTRFPKHQLAPESFVRIGAIHLKKCELEPQNPDLLSLAQINIDKFKEAFPGDQRIGDSEKSLLQMKEFYVQGLYDTGLFYEKIKKPQSSVVYYFNACSKFPETVVASRCQERLRALKEYAQELPNVEDYL